MKIFILILLLFSNSAIAWKNFENINVPKIIKPDAKQRLLLKKGITAIQKDNLKEALNNLVPIADMGYLKASVSLAKYLYKSKHMKLFKLSHKYHYIAAKHNMWQSQVVISYAYLQGDYTKKNFLMARYWLDKAAYNGGGSQIDSLYEKLNQISYKQAKILIEQKKYNAAEKILKPMAKIRYKNSKSLLNSIQKIGKNGEKKQKIVEKLNTNNGKKKQAATQYHLAITYLKDKNISKEKQQRALKLLKKSGAPGNSSAQFKLGLIMLKGDLIKQDIKQGIHWLRMSAEQENKDAQYTLGVYYISGTKIPKDDYEAHRWFKRASNNGHIKATHNLGITYLYGIGVSSDKPKAMYWLNKAKKNGNYKSSQILKNQNNNRASYKENKKYKNHKTHDKKEIYEAVKGHNWFSSIKGSDKYSLQLLVAFNFDTLLKFLKQNNIKSSYFHYSRKTDQSQKQHILIYGIFDDYESAFAYAKKISNDFKKFKPWVRKISAIEDETKL